MLHITRPLTDIEINRFADYVIYYGGFPGNDKMCQYLVMLQFNILFNCMYISSFNSMYFVFLQVR
jgi:hypothetical protein